MVCREVDAPADGQALRTIVPAAQTEVGTDERGGPPSTPCGTTNCEGTHARCVKFVFNGGRVVRLWLVHGMALPVIMHAWL